MKLMDKHKIKQVYDTLLMPIELIEDGSEPRIRNENGVIKSQQLYYSYYDPDMSDIAVGFYEIIYRDFIDQGMLTEDGYFRDKNFAGDTMNSFNTIANATKQVGVSYRQRSPKRQL